MNFPMRYLAMTFGPRSNGAGRGGGTAVPVFSAFFQLALCAVVFGAGPGGQAAEALHSDDCAVCHESGPRVGKRQPGVPPPFNAAALKSSPHAELDCTACHSSVTEVPHAEKVASVDCGGCHPDQQVQYAASLHGRAAARGDAYAPGCKSCHGTHNIVRASVPKSPISTIEIPRLCGNCHREGTPVSETRNIAQTNILGNYMDSIHGEGLFKKGLTVTAVCTSCHTAHSVLPHTDPRSSIAKANIAKTCTRCHGQIETVHRQVIRGEL